MSARDEDIIQFEVLSTPPEGYIIIREMTFNKGVHQLYFNVNDIMDSDDWKKWMKQNVIRLIDMPSSSPSEDSERVQGD